MIANKNEAALLKEARTNFIQGAGGIAVSLLGILNRVCGQIYALLYLSPRPLSLDDIVAELGVSKGSVSINIRLLEDYHLVKKHWVKGSRKDYFVAVDALPREVIKVFFDKIRRNIQDSLDMITDSDQMVATFLEAARGNSAEAAFMRERLRRVKSFYTSAHHLFDAIYAGKKIDASILKPILNGDRRGNIP